MKKAVQVDRWEIALARVAHFCAERVNRETGWAVSVEDILPIVAPNNFAGQREKRSFCREFVKGGEFGSNDFDYTLEELSQAATVIFGRLEPLAERGFRESNKANVWAYLASEAYGIMKLRKAA